jgi:Flp pilus assembly protein TadG
MRLFPELLVEAGCRQSLLRRYCSDTRGVIAVELALLLPIALLLLAMMVAFSQGMSIVQKVNLASRTVTDLVSQQSSPVSVANLTCILGSTASVLTPWDSSQLSVVVSEVNIDLSGNATVVWSQAAFNGVARAIGSVIPASSINTKFAKNSYNILGEVSYNYIPLNLYFSPAGEYTLSDAIYMVPRNSPNISLLDN